MKGSYRRPVQLSLLTEFEQRDDYPTLFCRCSGMRSVPPRGSGWVLVPSGEFTALMRGFHPVPRSESKTHPLPRGGTDLMPPRLNVNRQ
jgi:hypothetical protein